MKKLNLKWAAVVAIAVLIGAAVLTSCSKNEIYEPNVSETTHQLKRGKLSHYTISSCDLSDGEIGVMCKSGSSDDCWRLIDCKPSEGVLESHYSKIELYRMRTNPTRLNSRAIKELKSKRILPVK